MLEVLLVLLGWTLGMGSTLIVAAIQRKAQLTEINGAVLAELDELRNGLAWISFKIVARAGQVDRSYLSWFGQITNQYRGPIRDARLEAALARLSHLSDDELQAAVAAIQPRGRALGLNRLLTPAVTANLHHLGGFPEEYQRLLYDVVRQAEAINQEIAQADHFFKLTFDASLHAANRTIVESNLEESYLMINKLAKWIIESIDRLAQYRHKDFAGTLWLRNIWRPRTPAA